MVAHTLDELLVYRKALVASAAVSAVLEKPKVRADWDLRAQPSRVGLPTKFGLM